MNPEDTSIKTELDSVIPRPERRIVIIYVVLATLWVVGSDYLVEMITGDGHDSAHLQTFKGLNFVVTTAALLYVVLHRSFQRRRRAEAEARQADEEARQAEAEARQADAEARVAQERFELIARSASDALWDWNLGDNTIWWSEGFQKLFGHPKEEVEKSIESWTSRIHPDDRQRTIERIHQVIDSGGQVWWDEYRFVRRDGTYAEVFDRGYVIHDDAGKAIRMVGGITDVTRRKEAEQEILRSRQRLRALSGHLIRVKEEEHARISRQIHEDLGQLLTGLKMDLRWIEKRLEAREDRALNPLLDRLVEATELADACIKSVQEISFELRPELLDHLGLGAALRHEAGRMQDRTGICCELLLPDPPPEPPVQTATALFRVAREALTNIVRHAQASAVEIALREEADGFVLTVTDNGRGLPAAEIENPKSLGLFGMKERANHLGGEVSFGPGPGQRGTRVTLRLPRPQPEAEGAPSAPARRPALSSQLSP